MKKKNFFKKKKKIEIRWYIIYKKRRKKKKENLFYKFKFSFFTPFFLPCRNHSTVFSFSSAIVYKQKWNPRTTHSMPKHT